MRIKTPETILACDFCGETQYEVEQLIRGPFDVCICNACIDCAVKVLAEKAAEAKAGA